MGIVLFTSGYGMIMPITKPDGKLDVSNLLNHIALLEQMMETKSSKDEVTQLKSQLSAENTDLKSQLARALADLNTTQAELREVHEMYTALNNTLNMSTIQQGGATFTRWGKTTCPSDCRMVYKGFTSGTWFDQRGSPASILCLPEHPIYVNHMPGKDMSHIYGAEYETYESSIFGSVVNEDMPCVVCESNTRRSAIMVPARNQCHPGWTLEYSGYLMGGGDNQASSEFICVDKDPEAIQGGHDDKNGKIFYLVASKCGSLSCPPYVDNWTLSCCVCSQ